MNRLRGLIGMCVILAAGSAPAGTAMEHGGPGVLDTRAPLIHLFAPQGGEVFVGDEAITFEWYVWEPSLSGGLAAVRLEVFGGGQVIMSHELPAGALVDSVHVWEPGGSLPPDTRWRVAAVDAYGNAAAETSGVFVVTGVPGDGALPTRPALAEAYPNPFNPRITLRYALPRDQAVQVAVYDLAGRRVAVLCRGRQEAGWHEVEWDATGIPSGSYLARLETARGAASRKLMLVK